MFAFSHSGRLDLFYFSIKATSQFSENGLQIVGHQPRPNIVSLAIHVQLVAHEQFGIRLSTWQKHVRPDIDECDARKQKLDVIANTIVGVVHRCHSVRTCWTRFERDEGDGNAWIETASSENQLTERGLDSDWYLSVGNVVLAGVNDQDAWFKWIDSSFEFLVALHEVRAAEASIEYTVGWKVRVHASPPHDG